MSITSDHFFKVSNNLTGTLSSELGQMTHIRVFDIRELYVLADAAKIFHF